MSSIPSTRQTMKVALYSVLIAVFSSVGISCGDTEPVVEPELPTETQVVDDDGVEKPVQVVDGFEIYANRPENPDPDLLEMPDGIHLQPGVEVHRFEAGISEYVYIDEDAMQLIVSRPAMEYFDPVKRHHVISAADEFLFIVDDISRQGDVMVVDIAPFELHRVIWGNWRIPFKIDMSTVAEAAQNKPSENDPYQGGDDSNGEQLTTHRLASTFVDQTLEFSTGAGLAGQGELTDPPTEDDGSPAENQDGSVSVEVGAEVGYEVGVEAQYKLTATDHDGQFEGRLGSYNADYDCGQKGWIIKRDKKYCLDQIGLQVEVQSSFESKAWAKAEAKLKVEVVKNFLKDVPVVIIPLGPTSISVNLEFSLGLVGSFEVSGSTEVTAETSKTKTTTYGFRWTKAGKFGNGPSDTIEVFPKDGDGGGEEDAPFELEADEESEAGVEIEVALMGSFTMGVGVAANRLKMKLVDMGGGVGLTLSYNPFGLDSSGGDPDANGEEDCWSAVLFFEAQLVLKLQITGQLGIEWELYTLCDNDDPEKMNCLTFGDRWPLKSWGGPDYCLDRSFDTLVIDVDNPSDPIGADDIEGLYDVLALCKESAEGERQCVNEYGGKLDEAPDSCPIDSSNAVGLSAGRHEFTFPSPIEPDDTIILERNVEQGEGEFCAPSGQAQLFLKSGEREIELTSGPSSTGFSGSFGNR